MTTVREAIAALRKFPPNAQLVIAGDEEGNHFGDALVQGPYRGVKGDDVVVIYPQGYLMDEDIFCFDTIPCASCGMDVWDDGTNAHVHSNRVPCDEEVE